MIVVPTNLKPRRRSSRLIASDTRVLAGTCLAEVMRLSTGAPPARSHMNVSKAETCLRPLEDQKFEQNPVVMCRDTPFTIVVKNREVGNRPGAP